jgi:hypothetical protein
MATIPIRDQIISQLDRLSPEQQRQLLDYSLSLQRRRPPGISGDELIARAREINFSPEDLAEITQAIEEDCERIDWNEWQ